MYTKGPWTIQELAKDISGYSGWNSYCIRANNNIHLATVGDVDRFFQDDNESNARLIAAAPDLLEALKALFENCCMIHSHWGDGCNQKEADAAIRAAKAAIAKAEGGE